MIKKKISAWLYTFTVLYEKKIPQKISIYDHGSSNLIVDPLKNHDQIVSIKTLGSVNDIP